MSFNHDRTEQKFIIRFLNFNRIGPEPNPNVITLNYSKQRVIRFGFGSNSVRFGSVRFGSIRFG